MRRGQVRESEFGLVHPQSWFSPARSSRCRNALKSGSPPAFTRRIAWVTRDSPPILNRSLTQRRATVVRWHNGQRRVHVQLRLFPSEERSTCQRSGRSLTPPEPRRRCRRDPAPSPIQRRRPDYSPAHRRAGRAELAFCRRRIGRLARRKCAWRAPRRLEAAIRQAEMPAATSNFRMPQRRAGARAAPGLTLPWAPRPHPDRPEPAWAPAQMPS